MGVWVELVVASPVYHVCLCPYPFPSTEDVCVHVVMKRNGSHQQKRGRRADRQQGRERRGKSKINAILRLIMSDFKTRADAILTQ